MTGRLARIGVPEPRKTLSPSVFSAGTQSTEEKFINEESERHDID
jgi:hypothetical protein